MLFLVGLVCPILCRLPHLPLTLHALHFSNYAVPSGPGMSFFADCSIDIVYTPFFSIMLLLVDPVCPIFPRNTPSSLYLLCAQLRCSYVQSVYTISCSLMTRTIITLHFCNKAIRSKVTTIIVCKVIEHEQRIKYCAIL